MLLLATVHKNRFLRQRRKELVSTKVPQVPGQHWKRIGLGRTTRCLASWMGEPLKATWPRWYEAYLAMIVQYVFPAPAWL